MAAVVAVPRGFPVEILVDRLGTDFTRLLCTSCRLLTRDAVQGSCGHRFCSDCAQHLLRNTVDTGETVPCPGCVEEGAEDEGLGRDTVFPDAACRRELNRTQVRCIYGSCQWKGLYKDFDKHCQTCTEFPMACPSCGVEVARDQFETHCQTHQDLSGRVKPGDECPFGCGIKIDERGFSSHVLSSIAVHLQTIHSRLNALQAALQGRNIQSGATTTGDQYSQQQPINSRVERIESGLRQLESSLSTAGYSAASAQPRRTHGGVFDVKKAEELAGDVTILEHVLVVLASEMAKLTERLSKEGTECQTQLHAAQAKANALERTIAERDLTLGTLETSIACLEQASYDGTLVWRIGNVSKLRHEATASAGVRPITSPPFYTSQRGYKMHARVYLAGDGPGRSTHLSVYFVLACGHYDALLPWPFAQRVSLSLLDQVTGGGRGHVTDSFRPDSGAPYQRPRDPLNKAVGCPRFAPLTSLDGPNSAFVRDDCLFIRVIVDITGLH